MRISEQVRPAAVAGRFYPGNPAELRESVLGLLEDAPAQQGTVPKALIVPHAGYIYSGPVAASAYAQWRGAPIRRVVLLGPSHWVALTGLAAPSVAAFETPLGRVSVDVQALAALRSLNQVAIDDEPHEREHSLEVQLPFLQCVLERFEIVPLVVGDATSEDVAEVLEKLWGGPETGVVVSSDLSHYHSYTVAREWDQETAEVIESLAPERLKSAQACGSHPIRGLLTSAERRGLTVQRLDLRNSGDTAGPRDQVVGYGAWAFAEA